MIVADTIDAFRLARSRFQRLALVPTMGALHEGHLSLIRAARQLCPHVAVSIVVNPTQFGPSEDLSRYPRPIEQDLDKCRAEGVDLVLHPSVEQMYPASEPPVLIDIPSMTQVLEGTSRPGHFQGVLQVVAKLLSIAQPQVACFGRKDFQQLRIISAMVRALKLPVVVMECPTVREPDGLAMSSRNVYLTGDERSRALSIHRSLLAARRAFDEGERDALKISDIMRSILLDGSAFPKVPVQLDYATIVDDRTLEALGQISRPATAVVAMKVGTTRLIDNLALGSEQSEPL
jgi:pantoate--beta-alanine ligase